MERHYHSNLTPSNDVMSGPGIHIKVLPPYDVSSSSSIHIDGRTVVLTRQRAAAKEIRQFHHSAPVLCAVVSPNGELVASSTLSTTHLWHCASATVLESLTIPATCLAFSADSAYVAAGSSNGCIRLFSLVRPYAVDASPVAPMPAGCAVTALAFNGRSRLLCGMADGRVLNFFLNPRHSMRRPAFSFQTGHGAVLALHPCTVGNRCATYCEDGVVVIWAINEHWTFDSMARGDPGATVTAVFERQVEGVTPDQLGHVCMGIRDSPARVSNRGPPSPASGLRQMFRQHGYQPAFW
ncbi:hypothetical protein J8273_2264 [Carpediemonas membranifera]|uniref:Uncharacterized protein n=1 Tax=Carpediemonas membranifera TaxID=201153 RepID=A0A8J6AZ65_9EUKA|nr:hypothetical protein J8273_2264 [Carpediemonas membranifera]|eukprot:KAG9395915.1 hypothetical protein J8273_2264 [Carpediemonas membranifera]